MFNKSTCGQYYCRSSVDQSSSTMRLSTASTFFLWLILVKGAWVPGNLFLSYGETNWTGDQVTWLIAYQKLLITLMPCLTRVFKGHLIFRFGILLSGALNNQQTNTNIQLYFQIVGQQKGIDERRDKPRIIIRENVGFEPRIKIF